MNTKKSISVILLAALFLCTCLTACGEQKKAAFQTAAEKYLAFLGKTREEVLKGLELTEKDVSPDSMEVCTILDGREQFCGQSFSTQLYFDSADPETGEVLEEPALVSVRFLYSSPEPGAADYDLANAAYAELKKEYGAPAPLLVKDSKEHFQSIEKLESLKSQGSVSQCNDSWTEIGHEGMCAVLSAELVPNSMILGREDQDGSTFLLSLWYRWESKLK